MGYSIFNTYDNLRDDFGNLIAGRTKLFIESSKINDDGSFSEYLSGVAFSSNRPGVMFIVDDWIIPQLGKVEFIDGTLSVKDGEELMPPAKTEKELQIEAIERQLAALKAEPDEPVDIEEQTDTPLLDYTEQPAE